MLTFGVLFAIARQKKFSVEKDFFQILMFVDPAMAETQLLLESKQKEFAGLAD